MKIRRRRETPGEEFERLRGEQDKREQAADIEHARQIGRERRNAELLQNNTERLRNVAARKAERAQRRAGRKARRQQRPAGASPGSLRIPRTIALAAIAVVVGAASLTSFAESYRGLFDWAREHHLSGVWAAAWPLQLDTFIAVGELALFVALADQWKLGSRVSAWTVTLAGLAASVAGNIGHVQSPLLTDRATAAVPPLAAAAALAVGLGVLKRVVQAHHTRPDTSMAAGAPSPGLAGAPDHAPVPDGVPAPGVNGVPAPGTVPSPSRVPVPGQAPVPALPPAQARSQRDSVNGHGLADGDLPGELLAEFAQELAAGQVPSIRTIRARLRVGQDRARQVQWALTAHRAGAPEPAVPAAPGADSNSAVPAPAPS